MLEIQAHHRVGFAGASLTVGEYCAVITLEAVQRAFPSHPREDFFLRFVKADGVEGELANLPGSMQLQGVGLFAGDADVRVVCELSE